MPLLEKFTTQLRWAKIINFSGIPAAYAIGFACGKWYFIIYAVQGILGAVLQMRLRNQVVEIVQVVFNDTKAVTEKLDLLSYRTPIPKFLTSHCCDLPKRLQQIGLKTEWMMFLMAFSHFFDPTSDAVTAGSVECAQTPATIAAFSKEYGSVPLIGPIYEFLGLQGVLTCILAFSALWQYFDIGGRLTVILLGRPHYANFAETGGFNLDTDQNDHTKEKMIVLKSFVWKKELLFWLNRNSMDASRASLSFLAEMQIEILEQLQADPDCGIKSKVAVSELPFSRARDSLLVEDLPVAWFTGTLMSLAYGFDEDPGFPAMVSLAISLLQMFNIAVTTFNQQPRQKETGYLYKFTGTFIMLLTLLLAVRSYMIIWGCPKHKFDVWGHRCLEW